MLTDDRYFGGGFLPEEARELTSVLKDLSALATRANALLQVSDALS